ncbi:cell wall-associated protease precursor [Enterococcus mundtii 3F]|uniref:Ig-like domain-containing protein n=1 Tax=Enterococcus mundtii TaxID=53346 RepID=UPI002302CD72|nr:Ig-like domain-containing protein [Enterococcus mundtii]MDA9462053.1 cell wall-associated protease precursor [Enterococcus mundtii 3F]MEC3942618.1 Ig-like domain-containing protein [Enterococcus mundtii]
MKKRLMFIFLGWMILTYAVLSPSMTVRSETFGTIEPPSVNKITDQDRYLTGRGRPYTLAVAVIDTAVFWNYADGDGNFQIDLKSPHLVGTKIKVYQSDHGNSSPPIYVYVEKGESNLPAPPNVDPIHEQDQAVTGTTTPFALVKVNINGTNYEKKADGIGMFSIPIANYPVGTPVTVVSEVDGHESQPVTVYILANEQIELSMPEIEPVTDKDTKVIGKADPDVMVHLMIQGEFYEKRTEKSGEFTFQLDHTYNVGSEIQVHTSDDHNRRSPTLYTNVIQGALELGIDYITSMDTAVSGWASIGTFIDLQMGDRKYTGFTDLLGHYGIPLAQSYEANTKVHVQATDPLTGNTAEVNTLVYPREPSIYSVQSGATTISGVADPYGHMTVHFSNSQGNFIDDADAAGNYQVVVPSELVVKGATVYVSQVKNSLTSRESSLVIN